MKKRFTRPFVSHINGLGERQPCINDLFFPLFIVESGRFQLLAGDHSTKNSFDAVTCKLEQNLKAVPLSVPSLFNFQREAAVNTLQRVYMMPKELGSSL